MGRWVPCDFEQMRFVDASTLSLVELMAPRLVQVPGGPNGQVRMEKVIHWQIFACTEPGKSYILYQDVSEDRARLVFKGIVAALQDDSSLLAER